MKNIKYVIENKGGRGFFLLYNPAVNISFTAELENASKYNTESEAQKAIEEVNKEFNFDLEIRKVQTKYELI